MKKKIVAMLLTGAMVLSITACGGDKELEKENTAKTEATEKEPEVEVTYQSILDDYTKKIADATPGLVEEYNNESADIAGTGNCRSTVYNVWKESMIMAKELVFTSEKKTVYRDGSTAIKEFCDGFPKAEVLNEALCNARVEDIEALNVPKILGVSVIDGKWSILKEFVEGKTLQQLMDENPDRLEEYMEGMVDLHLLIHKQACPLLNKLKEKTIRALKSVEQLDDSTRYELMTRLDGMPKHTKLCHGDFNPSNIIVGDDGKWYVIDWVHASQGNASADVARTYLLLSLKDKKKAELYMDLFCEKTGTEKRYVQGWLPVVAAAQLAYKRPEEKELLESWINVFEYQ